MTFDQAFKGAYEDMYADTQMIREKRELKRTSTSTKTVPGSEFRVSS